MYGQLDYEKVLIGKDGETEIKVHETGKNIETYRKILAAIYGEDNDLECKGSVVSTKNGTVLFSLRKYTGSEESAGFMVNNDKSNLLCVCIPQEEDFDPYKCKFLYIEQGKIKTTEKISMTTLAEQIGPISFNDLREQLKDQLEEANKKEEE